MNKLSTTETTLVIVLPNKAWHCSAPACLFVLLSLLLFCCHREPIVNSTYGGIFLGNLQSFTFQVEVSQTSFIKFQFQSSIMTAVKTCSRSPDTRRQSENHFCVPDTKMAKKILVRWVIKK